MEIYWPPCSTSVSFSQLSFLYFTPSYLNLSCTIFQTSYQWKPCISFYSSFTSPDLFLSSFPFSFWVPNDGHSCFQYYNSSLAPGISYSCANSVMFSFYPFYSHWIFCVSKRTIIIISLKLNYSCVENTLFIIINILPSTDYDHPFPTFFNSSFKFHSYQINLIVSILSDVLKLYIY